MMGTRKFTNEEIDIKKDKESDYVRNTPKIKTLFNPDDPNSKPLIATHENPENEYHGRWDIKLERKKSKNRKKSNHHDTHHDHDPKFREKKQMDEMEMEFNDEFNVEMSSGKSQEGYKSKDHVKKAYQMNKSPEKTSIDESPELISSRANMTITSDITDSESEHEVCFFFFSFR